ncbi:MAG: R3H domain-containing nucleic acid-binding protein [Cyanobacteria bacterium J06632_22]
MGETDTNNGTEWLAKLLSLQGLEVDVSGRQEGELGSDSASYWLTIDDATLSEDQVEALIGERGKVLDAIQYLASTILNIGAASDAQQAYTVELAGYRQRRQAELQEMADNAAAEAKETNREVEIKGLSSAERRQVHTLIKEHGGLETFSRGREPDRRLVVHVPGAESTEVAPEASPEATAEDA